MARHEIQKLPQARLYLKAAEWGINEMVSNKFGGYAFRFYLIGILASLRTVQHALYKHDRKLSPQHEKVIGEWWQATKPDQIRELAFIKMARDKILKEGTFDAWAARSESATGEGSNYTVTSEDYDLAYYVGKTRHELLPELQDAATWCEQQLTSIEAKLPPLYIDD